MATPRFTILTAGVDFEIALLDNSKQTVKVRQLPVRLMSAYLEAQGDEPKMIELATGLQPEVVDSLTQESHADLVAKIEEVNADFFSAWGNRQKARVAKIKAAFATNATANES